MGVYCIIIERGRVANVYVRIDQSGNEKSPLAFNAPRMGASNKIRADFSDSPITDHNVCMLHGGYPLR
jgi:hypothetical protein